MCVAAGAPGSNAPEELLVATAEAPDMAPLGLRLELAKSLLALCRWPERLTRPSPKSAGGRDTLPRTSPWRGGG